MFTTLHLWINILSLLDTQMALQPTEMSNNTRHELTIFDHYDCLNIAISDQLIDKGKVLTFHL